MMEVIEDPRRVGYRQISSSPEGNAEKLLQNYLDYKQKQRTLILVGKFLFWLQNRQP